MVTVTTSLRCAYRARPRPGGKLELDGCGVGVAMVERRWLWALFAGALLAGCTSSSPHSAPSASPPSAVPIPVQCGAWSCQQAQTVPMGNGYAVSVWHAGQSGDFTTRPVVELTSNGVPVQWLLVANGYGWGGTLTCATAGCVLIDGQGAHSGLAQELLLRAGRLVPVASASSDSATIVAEDLDGDGNLDVLALDSDFNPNYAAGHLFWHTYRFTGSQLVSTGCTAASTIKAPQPTQFATGACLRNVPGVGN